MTAERRLAKVEAGLTPTQLVLRWLDEAHAFDELDAYVRWLLDQPATAYPATRLAREAVEGTRARLGRRGPDEMDTAVRQALRETLFRFELVLRINVVAHETLEREALLRLIFSMRFAMLCAERRSTAVDEDLAGCRGLIEGRDRLLREMEAARTTAEARHLDGHPALFPGERRRWEEGRKDAGQLVDLAARMAELDGWGEVEAPDDPDASDAHVAQLLADLVEPARVTALDKLDEGSRALSLATRWLRPKLEGESPAVFDSAGHSGAAP